MLLGRASCPRVRGRRAQAALALLPALALLVIFGVHNWRVEAHDQSRWKGGGLGMFSSLDAGPHRQVVIEVLHKGERYRVVGSKEAMQELTGPIMIRELQAVPKRSQLELLGRYVLAGRFVDATPGYRDMFLALVQGRQVGDAFDEAGLRAIKWAKALKSGVEGPGIFRPDAVHITLYRRDFDSHERRLQWRPLRSHTVQARESRYE